ncbi:MAG TPA: response regulator, partial [Kofleriaceae bacterium]|nr:response regulator [Kofleriaceae bacterium]
LPVATELPAPIIASVAAPRRGKVIVIDDEPLLLGSIRRVLARDHDVEAFDDADRAFDAIIARPDLDVILCDLIMPKVSGMDLYERLLSATPDLAARVVFVTGGAFSQQGREFLAAVPNRVIEKPFGPDRLRSLVRELVAQRS